MKKTMALILAFAMILSMGGCAMFGSKVESLRGSIVGNTYECQFYTNNGVKFMAAIGDKIDIVANVVKERIVDGDGDGYAKTLSSVLTITSDGHEMSSCGSTILFVEKGLTPDLVITNDISSNSKGVGSNTAIANIINRFKNNFGKPVVAVIQSQLGDPICAYSGNEVYWEVCENLPKTTKLMIDGKALYIHRANFQLIDTALLS